MAQHGAAGATHGQRLSEQESEERFSPDERARFLERQAKRDAAAQRIDGLREEARKAVDRSGADAATRSSDGSKPTIDRRPLPGRPPQFRDSKAELSRTQGPDRGQRSWKLFQRAAREFEAERYTDAHRTLKPLVETNPDLADLRELYGLTLYRLGRWDAAIEELERFRSVSGTTEQHPVLMDAHRAEGNWADVEELWSELGEASPSTELMIEGRIVRAGAEADRGRVDNAVRILEKGWKVPREPMEHHLRRAYALADLLERAGKIPRSRKLFEWIARVEPHFGDADDRARALQ
ncbi:MAG: hypothetical protein ACR2P0_16600 [Acidimicrobiales bacterium]